MPVVPGRNEAHVIEKPRPETRKVRTMSFLPHPQTATQALQIATTLGGALTVLLAAIRAGAAAERHAVPAAADLRTLGIAPESLPRGY